MYWPMMPPQKTDGEKHREQRQRGRHDGAEDFAGPLQDRLHHVVAHVPVPLYVFRDNDGVVHDDTDADDHGLERNKVERKAAQVVEDR